MDKIFFEIDPKEENGKNIYVARIQVSDLPKAKRFNVDLAERAEYLEILYRDTIMFCREGLEKIKKAPSEKRILIYWDVANRVWEYLEISEKNGFFLNNYYKHFIRDLNVSRETVKRLLRLRRAVKDKSNLDLTKSWVYYTRRYVRLKSKQP
jgi:hypothetical protein